MEKHGVSVHRIIGGAVGLAGIALLVFAVRHSSDIESFARLLRHARPAWLIAALTLQATTYVSIALGWAAVLRRAGTPLTLRKLLPIALSKLFADQMIPAAGMGGNMLLVERLIKLGTPRGTAVAALLVSMIGFYAVYAFLALVMLWLLWLGGYASLPIAIFVGIFLVVAVTIPGFALWLRRRGSHTLSPLLERLPPVRTLLHIVGEAPGTLVSDPRLIVRVALCNGLIFLADAGTMMVCLRALGEQSSYATSLIAVVVASMVVTLGPIPLGLGTFELGATAMLKMLGVPLVTALAATLLFRAFTLWLPLLPGLISMRGMLGAQGRKSRAASTPLEQQRTI
jgi:uncharacterized protein (TIRG00374 family)